MILLQSLIDSIRSVIGIPSFYLASGDVDYGAVTEYFVCALVLLVVIASVFRFLTNLVNR